ncbi:MAG: hypothetical protein HYX68_09500 [Planctomycetes bacterium]|nr:hypothetical protein [Planctomycetota bacterium]
MSLACAQCSRTNPADAAYCYFDGAALRGRGTGPVDAGAQNFLQPFTFANGLTCRNFDQLAMACQTHWRDAVELLRRGHLGSFFGSLGRVDLAAAADEAAKFPDADRGLDQLLGRLPTRALQPPKLRVEPGALNLGAMKIGEDRVFDLHLVNQGMKLLYGTVASDCDWLTVGAPAGHPAKIFQTGSETVLPIRVRGQHLRASNQPLAGTLLVESNGGTKKVTVQVAVPITPFSGGPFAGAVTPRQIAEKAKLQPKQAAPFFESGAVAKWYAANGWSYPVQGPPMPGVGGVQQFFEALGVTKPPVVAIAPRVLDFQAAGGQVINTSITITLNDTGKRKPIYGWATCGQPWVRIGATVITTKSATIPITLNVPHSPDGMVSAEIRVLANGNQKTVVPLRVIVTPGTPRVGGEDISVELVPKPAPAPARAPVAPASLPVAAPVTTPTPESLDFGALPVYRRRGMTGAQKLSLVGPLLLLLAGVALLGVRDWRVDASDEGHPDPRPVTVLKKTDGPINPGDVDPTPRIRIVFDEGVKGADYTDSMMFAVHKLGAGNRGDVKLNWYDNGLGNSTVARIDMGDNVFGNTNFGFWQPAGPAKSVGRPGGKERTFVFSKSDVRVTQTVTIETGEPVQLTSGQFKRPLNVCMVKYTIVNGDGKIHRVGLRTLLDTCIGQNDGVPFTIPGETDLVSTSRDFRDTQVPHFVQVLEKPDLKDPGTVVHLNMRLADRLEVPSRFSLTRYPVSVSANRADLNRWDVPIVDIGDDSCVVMYWRERAMKPNEVREVAYSYGLGNLSLSAPETKTTVKGRLGVSIGGAMYVNGELTVVALIADPDAKTATLRLPEGLKLADASQSLTQAVRKAVVSAKGQVRPVPVTWKARAVQEGNHQITVSTDTKLTHSRRVSISLRSLFN